MPEEILDVRALLEGNERYEFVRTIGRGFCAVVAEIHDRSLGKNYALKILIFAPNSKIGRRFKQEVLALRELTSPHLVKSFDFLELSGHLAVVMEIMDGDLESYLREHGPLGVADALAVALAVGSALKVAHEAGIVHRDVKPSNVLLRDGLAVIRVSDFGIAQTSGGHHGMTAVGTTMGSPAFMAPEQAKDAKCADARADIFSLGKLVYTLFNLNLLTESADAFPRLVHFGLLKQAEIPEDIATVIKHATMFDRDERYQTMGEMLGELRACQQARAHQALTRRTARAIPEQPEPVIEEDKNPEPRRAGPTITDLEDPEPVFEPKQVRSLVPVAVTGIGLIALVALVSVIIGLAWRFWPSESPTQVVETPATNEIAVPIEPSVIEVAEPEVVEVPSPQPEAVTESPVPVTRSPAKEKVSKTEPTKAEVTAFTSVPEPEPEETPPTPPPATTGTVSVTGDFHQAELRQGGLVAKPGTELQPGVYQLWIEFRAGGGLDEVGRVEVSAGSSVTIRCADFDCRW